MSFDGVQKAENDQFTELGLFCVSAGGWICLAQLSNKPLSRPDGESLLSKFDYVMENDQVARGGIV